MSGYIKFYDEAALWLRILLSILGLPAFLYRLFKVIIDKAQDKQNLTYLILNVIPVIGTVIAIVDIVWCALKRPLPLNFGDWSKAKAAPAPAAAEEPKEEAAEAEEPKAE